MPPERSSSSWVDRSEGPCGGMKDPPMSNVVEWKVEKARLKVDGQLALVQPNIAGFSGSLLRIPLESVAGS